MVITFKLFHNYELRIVISNVLNDNPRFECDIISALWLNMFTNYTKCKISTNILGLGHSRIIFS